MAMNCSIFPPAARQLEHEVVGGGIDHLGAENLRHPQRLDALLAAARHLHQHQLALQRPAQHGEVDDAMHVDQTLQLALDLGQHLRRAGGDDRKAREMLLVLRLRYGETLDIVAAPGEQPGDAGEHAGLVVHHHRESVRDGRLLAVIEEVGGAGLLVGHGRFLTGDCQAAETMIGGFVGANLMEVHLWHSCSSQSLMTLPRSVSGRARDATAAAWKPRRAPSLRKRPEQPLPPGLPARKPRPCSATDEKGLRRPHVRALQGHRALTGRGQALQ